MAWHTFQRRDTGELLDRSFLITEKVPDVLTHESDPANIPAEGYEPGSGLPEGVEADRIYVGGGGRDAVSGKWPIHSDALAYHPNQVNRALKEHIGADIDGDGRPILTDPQHRRRVLKAVGAVDKSGYY